MSEPETDPRYYAFYAVFAVIHVVLAVGFVLQWIVNVRLKEAKAKYDKNIYLHGGTGQPKQRRTIVRQTSNTPPRSARTSQAGRAAMTPRNTFAMGPAAVDYGSESSRDHSVSEYGPRISIPAAQTGIGGGANSAFVRCDSKQSGDKLDRQTSDESNAGEFIASITIHPPHSARSEHDSETSLVPYSPSNSQRVSHQQDQLALPSASSISQSQDHHTGKSAASRRNSELELSSIIVSVSPPSDHDNHSEKSPSPHTDRSKAMSVARFLQEAASDSGDPTPRANQSVDDLSLPAFSRAPNSRRLKSDETQQAEPVTVTVKRKGHSSKAQSIGSVLKLGFLDPDQLEAELQKYRQTLGAPVRDSFIGTELECRTPRVHNALADPQSIAASIPFSLIPSSSLPPKPSPLQSDMPITRPPPLQLFDFPLPTHPVPSPSTVSQAAAIEAIPLIHREQKQQPHDELSYSRVTPRTFGSDDNSAAPIITTLALPPLSNQTCELEAPPRPSVRLSRERRDIDRDTIKAPVFEFPRVGRIHTVFHITGTIVSVIRLIHMLDFFGLNNILPLVVVRLLFNSVTVVLFGTSVYVVFDFMRIRYSSLFAFVPMYLAHILGAIAATVGVVVYTGVIVRVFYDERWAWGMYMVAYGVGLLLVAIIFNISVFTLTSRINGVRDQWRERSKLLFPRSEIIPSPPFQPIKDVETSPSLCGSTEPGSAASSAVPSPAQRLTSMLPFLSVAPSTPRPQLFRSSSTKGSDSNLTHISVDTGRQASDSSKGQSGGVTSSSTPMLSTVQRFISSREAEYSSDSSPKSPLTPEVEKLDIFNSSPVSFRRQLCAAAWADSAEDEDNGSNSGTPRAVSGPLPTSNFDGSSSAHSSSRSLPHRHHPVGRHTISTLERIPSSSCLTEDSPRSVERGPAAAIQKKITALQHAQTTPRLRVQPIGSTATPPGHVQTLAMSLTSKLSLTPRHSAARSPSDTLPPLRAAASAINLLGAPPSPHSVTREHGTSNSPSPPPINPQNLTAYASKAALKAQAALAKVAYTMQVLALIVSVLSVSIGCFVLVIGMRALTIDPRGAMPSNDPSNFSSVTTDVINACGQTAYLFVALWYSYLPIRYLCHPFTIPSAPGGSLAV